MASTRLTKLWVIALSPLAMTGPLAFADGPTFTKLVVDPTDSHIIFSIFDTASPDGSYLLRSTNSGSTWSRVARPDSRGYISFGGRMSVENVLLFIRERPTRVVQIVFLTLDDLWTASSRLEWTHDKAPDYMVSVWWNQYSEVLYFITNSAPDGNAKLYAKSASEDGWRLINARLPFTCGHCGGVSLSSSQMVVSESDDILYYSGNSGKSWMEPDSQWIENFNAERMRGILGWHAPYSREQIDAGIRAVRAHEIQIEEEFERVRSD